MKITLLFGFLLLSFLTNAQSPINSFYIQDDAYFAVVTSNTPIDQTASGANQVWNFDQLVAVGTSNYTNAFPNAEETATFPNTNGVILSTSTNNMVTATSQLFLKDVATVISITGLRSADLELNFTSNNATLGAFPMNYGFTNTDLVAGTFSYTTYSGTFTGNIVTSVDAYGTLYRNEGGIPNSNVTRLKTVITISLNYGFFNNVGTITQTTYSYYQNAPSSVNAPLFRTSTTTAVVPLASIDQTDTLMESFSAVILGTDGVSYQKKGLEIAPNPVVNRLELKLNDTLTVYSIAIVDAAGKIVLTQDMPQQFIDVSALQKGIYLVKIETNQGSMTKKILKE